MARMGEPARETRPGEKQIRPFPSDRRSRSAFRRWDRHAGASRGRASTHQLTASTRRDAWPLLIEWLRRDEVHQRTDRREAGVVRVRAPVADRAPAPFDEARNQLLDFLEIDAEIGREAVRRAEWDRGSAQRREWKHCFPHHANRPWVDW